MTKLALCLSGGGAKGAYEIGVYRALRKLKKNPQIVTGTSVGALNGMMIVQGDLYKSYRVWSKMSFSTIYDENSFSVCENYKILDVYKQYAKAFVTEGGMNIDRLVNLVKDAYNSKKFFTSPIDFGLVTYNLSKNEPVIKQKKDMNEDNVTDYVIASASCYPAFKPYKIDGDDYVDGGYYDNLPIELSVQMGAEEIIAVDLRAVGAKREFKTSVPVLKISPRNKMVSFLVFDKEKSSQALKFGYNDTMKTFGRLDGDKFTFKSKNLVKNYMKYNEKFTENLNNILNGNSTLLDIPVVKSFINNKTSYRQFNKLVENAGFCFEFREDVIYHIKTYNKGLFNELLKVDSNNITLNIKDSIFNKKQTVKYFYEEIVSENVKKITHYIPLCLDEFLIALYIYTIKGHKKTY